MSELTIEQTLNEYFDGLYFCDLDKLAQVFHPLARYTTTTGGELLHLTMAEYFAILKERIAPATNQQIRDDRILLIDQIAPHTALAKVQCVIEPKYFTDFLSLIKVDGRWQIISKVFHYQLNHFNHF